MARRGGRPLSRSRGSKPEKRTIYVFTEGRLTEPLYVNALKSLPRVRERTALKIEVRGEHTVPRPLVELAVQKAREPEVDEVWCIFDVDDHPRLSEAVALAEEHGIKVVVSNPCFELWLILHERDQTAALTTKQAVRDAQTIAGVNGKSLDAATLLPRRIDAVQRAEKLDANHERNGHPLPHNNPSTGMPALLKAIEGTAG